MTSTSSHGRPPARATRRREGTPRRRADAERNIGAILDAALTCFSERPDANMTSIAEAADVSRVTLYAHFPSREELLAAVLEKAVLDANEALSYDGDGSAADALSGLVRSSWPVLDRYRNVMAAAATGLSERQLRTQQHHSVVSKVQQLIERGQEERVFRTDLPSSWLVSVFHSLVHQAAEDVRAKRLRRKDVPDILDATLAAVMAAPGRDNRGSSQT